MIVTIPSSIQNNMQQQQAVSESDEPYYPMGSEMSARPTTPRFIIEEVSSNYEPVMVARDPAPAPNSTSAQAKVLS